MGAKNALIFKMNLMNFECLEPGNTDVDELSVLMQA